MPFSDEWLVPTLVTLVPEAQMSKLRRETDAMTSAWEAVVDRRLATDNQVLKALSTRFGLPIADLSELNHKIQDSVPEAVSRKYNVLPLRITDSYLEIASANPFDIDAEKMLRSEERREGEHRSEEH